MKIRALTTFKHYTLIMSEGDVLTVDDTVGGEVVANGWAENVETGEINPTGADEATLSINSSVIGITNTRI